MQGSIETQNVKFSIRMVVIALIFIVGTVASGAMWAQSIYSRLGNVEVTLREMRDSMKVIADINALREITIRNDARIERLEEWRLRHVSGDEK